MTSSLKRIEKLQTFNIKIEVTKQLIRDGYLQKMASV